MIVYIIKFIIGSGGLLLLYHALLQREKTYQFNRFYLLLTLPLALIIPFINLDTKIANAVTSDISVLYDQTIAAEQLFLTDSTSPTTTSQSFLSWDILLIAGYILVSSLLVGRFLINLFNVIKRIRKQQAQSSDNAHIIISDEVEIPHTFLHYIFINHIDLENKQIVTHELTHAKQKHSLDILFIELIHCFLWINPVVILLKKAIRLNHEFIADHAVIGNSNHTAEYLQLLLSKARSPFKSSFASSFSYSLTKKRFTMMTKTQNFTRSTIKVSVCVALTCSMIFIFSEKTNSQANQTSSITLQDTIATPAMVVEFEQLVSKYKVTDPKLKFKHLALNVTNLTIVDRERMKEIYSKMSQQQKSKYPEPIIYVAGPTPIPAKKNPTSKELISWQDSKTFGVWLDGKKISNTKLEGLKTSDIGFYTVSRLLGEAARNVSYKIQVDLMTQEYYDKTYPSKSN